MSFFRRVGRSISRTFRRGVSRLTQTLLGFEQPEIPEIQLPEAPEPPPEQAIYEMAQRGFETRRRRTAPSTLLTGPFGLAEGTRARRKTLLGE